MLLEFTVIDVVESMIVLFFWFMLIWMFIAVFADVFRRDDLSGWHKAGWLLFVFVLPRFVKMYSDLGAELPLPTRILMGMVTHVYVVLPAVIGALILGRIAWRMPSS